MKSLTSVAALIILSCFYSAPAEAQGGYPSLVCYECRDLRNYPRDFRNFAYNQVFSPDGNMSYDDGDFFRVTNLFGQSVLVDMNMDIGLILIDVRLPFAVPIPTVVRIQIILIYENGDQIDYRIDPRAHPNGLPVGRRGARRGDGPVDRSYGGPVGGTSRLPGGFPNRVCGITRVDGGRGRRTCL